MNHEVTREGDPPVLDGTGDEAPCPHCLLGPAGCCVGHLTGEAAPCLVNDQPEEVQAEPAVLAAFEGLGGVGNISPTW